MADPNRTGTTTRTNTTTPTTKGRSNNTLWIVIGAVVVLALLYFFVFAGTDTVEDPAVEGGAPAVDAPAGDVAPVEGGAVEGTGN
ncbi:hypothetical protein [uncultured Jannaschia sp.]|uniref:hypothetical protein n=1 Tax=uncultured Jannaschia sp. TaxID=293347 RepID=UPI002616AA82|nr:hypothetical protein [uncultured Jannaschia sp.]